MTKIMSALPVRILAMFLGAVGVLLLVGGLYLVALGGSPYHALAGAAVLGSAILTWRGRRWGAWLYGAMLLMSLLWSLWEIGFDFWALLPRLLGPALVGLLFLIPPVQRRLDRSRLSSRLFVPLVAGAVVVLGAGIAISGQGTEPLPLPARLALAADPTAGAVPDDDWPAYGRSQGGTRFSPLSQITPANVAGLEPAWSFRVGSAAPGVTATLETTPLKIGDTLYLCNGANKLYALDAETGKLRWAFDPRADMRGLLVATCRGVAYYRAPDATAGSECAARIVTTTVDARLIAVDAATGRPCGGFGANGSVDLKRGLGPHIRGYYSLTSAPTIVRGRIVLGGWITDNQMIGEPSGVVRAFDAATGRFAWAWDMGRPGISTEPGPGERYTPGTPNVWAPPSADESLGLVYLPTGNPTPDFWGGKRSPASERFGSSVVALDAETGALRWSYQTTHHDLWDYDIASQPTLVDFPVAGRLVPALIQPTKRGETFVLDRRTGRPLVDVVERRVPQGAAPGDWLSPTQPFPIGMPSMAGPPLAERDMWGLTPIDQMWCRILFRRARYEGPFTPPGTTPYIQYPGYSGGSSWGGVAVDPERRVMVINVNRFAQYGWLIPRAEADRAGMKPFTGMAGKGHVGESALGKPQVGTPFAVEMTPFVSRLNMPCQRPPFGMIAAVDLTTRKIIWTRPLGTARDSGPMGLSSGMPIPLGTPNLGGAVVTRSGLVFIGATQERALRALDLSTGRILWQARLPSGGNATPMTYRSAASGRQFVVIAAGGNVLLGGPPGDYIIAYALSKQGRK